MKEIQLYRGLLGGHSGKTKLESRLELRWEVEYMDVWGQAVGAGGGQASDENYQQLQSWTKEAFFCRYTGVCVCLHCAGLHVHHTTAASLPAHHSFQTTPPTDAQSLHSSMEHAYELCVEGQDQFSRCLCRNETQEKCFPGLSVCYPSSDNESTK